MALLWFDALAHETFKEPSVQYIVGLSRSALLVFLVLLAQIRLATILQANATL